MGNWSRSNSRKIHYGAVFVKLSGLLMPPIQNVSNQRVGEDEDVVVTLFHQLEGRGSDSKAPILFRNSAIAHDLQVRHRASDEKVRDLRCLLTFGMFVAFATLTITPLHHESRYLRPCNTCTIGQDTPSGWDLSHPSPMCCVLCALCTGPAVRI